MSGDTHAAVGAASALLITRPTTLLEAAISIGFGMLGGLLIDIDTKQSKGAKLGRIIMIPFFCYVVVGLYLFVRWNKNYLFLVTSQLETKTLIAILMIGALYLYGYHTPHRKFTHSIEFIGMTGILYYMAGFQFTLPLLVGKISHVLIDLLNKTSVRLSCIFQFDFCIGLVSSDGICNRILKVLAIIISVIILFLYFIQW